MTLDTLAGMVQRGFTGVREEFTSVREEIADIRSTMATKEDLEGFATKADLVETREVLARAIKDLETKLFAYVGSNREEFERLKTWMEDIDERLSALEGRRHKKAA